jgi:hypothetical protein
VGGALKRRHRRRGPHADEAHAAAVGLRGVDRAAHLHRQRDRLRQQDRDEEQRILESGEEFHRPGNIISEFRAGFSLFSRWLRAGLCGK